MQQAKILVVDDEPDLEHLILQKFRKKISSKEYEFQFARDGAEAIDIIVNNGSINLILTDINMPVMDGLTLLSKINELNNRLHRSVIVSAYGDMENIRTAMNRGAYDFITKPIDLNDLEITIDKYRLGIVIGDVSGKGIASALLMAVCKTLLKITAYKGIPADNILYEVNNILVDESPSNMFVTVFYGVLDTRNGAFEYCNGGHSSPYLISSEGKITQLENIGGLLLGAMKDAEYESNIAMLNPGDTLFLYTDGITEA